MGIKFLSFMAAVLITIAVILKTMIPQTYRFGIGGHYYRPDYAYWVLLLAGIVLGVIVVLKIIARTQSV
jgi:hypothetical protein